MGRGVSIAFKRLGIIVRTGMAYGTVFNVILQLLLKAETFKAESLLFHRSATLDTRLLITFKSKSLLQLC